MLALATLGASFRSPFRDDRDDRDDEGGVAVWVRALFAAFSFSLVGGNSTSGEYSRPTSVRVAGDDGSRFDGSTGGRFGLRAKWLTWAAISAARPPADNGLFRAELRDGVREYVVAGVNSTNDPCVDSKFPGVELKTEYCSAKRGVQPPGSSSGRGLLLGVLKTGLGKAVDAAVVGVCLGVGGSAFGSPKLHVGQRTKSVSRDRGPPPPGSGGRI
jgi:hypothetical protein